MIQIETYVFFDIETTGLPWQEKNRTKITELCLLAVSRKDIENFDTAPPVSKLTFVVNPGRKVQPVVESLTGLTNEYLKNSPSFEQKSNSIINFLNGLANPVCLVAHNGNAFDYKILLAECNEANITLPSDLLCVDTLPGFRKCLKEHYNFKNISNSQRVCNEALYDDLLTDDEDITWEELNVTPEDWAKIDDLCISLISVSCDSEYNPDKIINKQDQTKDNNFDKEKKNPQTFIDEKIIEDSKKKRNMKLKKLFDDSNNRQSSVKEKAKGEKGNKKAKYKTEATINSGKGQFSLSGVYQRIKKKDFNAHRAEDDCFALLECVMAMKEFFLPWMDGTCKKITEITPLMRK